MLTPEQMKGLKQANVSKDTEKTKQRFKDDYSGSTVQQKQELCDISGQGKHSFYRVIDEGTSNARLITAMSTVFNVSPFYYIGAEDEKTPFSDKLLVRFLRECGYDELADELKKGKQRKGKVKEDITPISEDSNKVAKTVSNAPLDILTEVPAAEIIKSGSVYKKAETKIMAQPASCDECAESKEFIAEITEDDTVFLLKAMFIRAKMNKTAGQKLDSIKKLLTE